MSWIEKCGLQGICLLSIKKKQECAWGSTFDKGVCFWKRILDEMISETEKILQQRGWHRAWSSSPREATQPEEPIAEQGSQGPQWPEFPHDFTLSPLQMVLVVREALSFHRVEISSPQC